MYLQNKYTRVYFSIIENARNRTIEGYKEKHHIIPQSLGGSNDLNNIVELTAREHFVCHLLLTKMVEGIDKSKMYQAAWMMAFVHGKGQERYRVNNRTYEKLRLEMSAVKKSMSTWNKGLPPTDETRLKLRAASISKLVRDGKITQDEANRRNSLPLQEIKRWNKRKPKAPKVIEVKPRKKWSDEAKARLSAQRMGRTPWNKGRSSKQSSGHDSELS
jgi:hypothetical protein